MKRLFAWGAVAHAAAHVLLPATVFAEIVVVACVIGYVRVRHAH